MSQDQITSPTGSAAAGVCMPPRQNWPLTEIETPQFAAVALQAFALEANESMRSREEQKFFDWSVGILEDSGIVGILRNDYVYQATTLQGEVHTGAGRPYSVTLSRTSVVFDDEETASGPIQFTGSVLDTEGEDLEANQVGRTFDAARRQSTLLRAWKDCTSMRSAGSVIFKDLRVLFDNSEFAMEVESDLGEFTVSIRRTANAEVFRYSLTDASTPIVHSPRVADALLSDAAEEAGGVPEPASVLCAMIAAAEMAQRDPEWLAAAARRRSGRPQSKVWLLSG